MARTYRRVYNPTKSHHKNAIPYKRRNSTVIFAGTIEDMEVTIERVNRRKAQY